MCPISLMCLIFLAKIAGNNIIREEPYSREACTCDEDNSPTHQTRMHLNFRRILFKILLQQNTGVLGLRVPRFERLPAFKLSIKIIRTTAYSVNIIAYVVALISGYTRAYVVALISGYTRAYVVALISGYTRAYVVALISGYTRAYVVALISGYTRAFKKIWCRRINWTAINLPSIA